jgi:hypothetical protein
MLPLSAGFHLDRRVCPEVVMRAVRAAFLLVHSAELCLSLIRNDPTAIVLLKVFEQFGHKHHLILSRRKWSFGQR